MFRVFNADSWLRNVYSIYSLSRGTVVILFLGNICSLFFSVQLRRAASKKRTSIEINWGNRRECQQRNRASLEINWSIILGCPCKPEYKTRIYICEKQFFNSALAHSLIFSFISANYPQKNQGTNLKNFSNKYICLAFHLVIHKGQLQKNGVMNSPCLIVATRK